MWYLVSYLAFTISRSLILLLRAQNTPQVWDRSATLACPGREKRRYATRRKMYRTQHRGEATGILDAAARLTVIDLYFATWMAFIELIAPNASDIRTI